MNKTRRERLQLWTKKDEREQHEWWTCLNRKYDKYSQDRNRQTDAKPEEMKDRKEKIREIYQLQE